MKDFDSILVKGKEIGNKAKQGAVKAIEMGQKTAKQYLLKQAIEVAQQKLGETVYCCAKTGVENKDGIEKYINQIEDLSNQLELLETTKTVNSDDVIICENCGNAMNSNTIFCTNCGEKVNSEE